MAGKGLSRFVSSPALPLAYTDDEAARVIQAFFRGFKGRKELEFARLVISAAASEAEIKQKELMKRELDLKWERSRLRLKMQTRMKLRRMKRTQELHKKLDNENEGNAAGVIQNLWRMQKRQKEMKEEERRIKKERAKQKKKLMVMLSGNQRRRQQELHEKLRLEAQMKAARLVQNAWRAKQARRERADRMHESGLTREQLLENWERATFKLRARKALQRRRELRQQHLRAELAREADRKEKGLWR